MLAMNFTKLWLRPQRTMMKGYQCTSSWMKSPMMTYMQIKNFSTSAGLQFVPHEQKEVPELPPKCVYPTLEQMVRESENPDLYKIKRFESKTKSIAYSSWKLNDCAKLIRGKHILDAMKIAEGIDKKGGPIIVELLGKVKEKGIAKGYNPDLFFIKEAYVGKAVRSKKLDIKARGKMGIIRSPQSSITIVMEERPVNDMIKDVLVGKTPPGIGEIFRKRLFRANADFHDLQKYSFMITSRGRRYRRQQFQRLVMLTQKDYQRQGIFMRYKDIVKFLLEKQVQTITQNRIEQRELAFRQRNTDRQAHFDKNYKKK